MGVKISNKWLFFNRFTAGYPRFQEFGGKNKQKYEKNAGDIKNQSRRPRNNEK